MDQNTEQIARWLDAKHYISKYKPIPIDEFWTLNNSIYPATTARKLVEAVNGLEATQSSTVPVSEIVKKFESEVPSNGKVQVSGLKELQNPVTNMVVALAVETANKGHGSLVFCSNRKGCETLAVLISKAIPWDSQILDDLTEQRNEVLSELRSLPIRIPDELGQTVSRGVAYHRR